MNRTDWTIAGIAAVAMLASAIHGWAHATIPVDIPGWQLGAAIFLLFVLLLSGLVLLATGRRVTGLGTLFGAGLAGLAFEGLFHFVVENPDHVSTVEHGQTLFANTALLSTAGNGVLAIAAAWFLWDHLQGPSSSSSIASIR